LPSIDERQADLFASLNGKGPVLADHDLTGFFCGHTKDWSGHADGFRALLRPTPRVVPIVQQALTNLRTRGKTLVAVQSFVRPDPDLHSLVPFEPRNAQMLLQPTAGKTLPDAPEL
jgi:hypothetical protein